MNVPEGINNVHTLNYIHEPLNEAPVLHYKFKTKFDRGKSSKQYGRFKFSNLEGLNSENAV